MKKNDIPILKALEAYSKEGLEYFHMPGHKGGNVYHKAGIESFDRNLLSMDVTEVPGVDNLHCPEGAIKEAQDLAAEAFGAEHTFFLVNGTTGGIYSMILASTNPGDKIIIPRNCHKSVTGAVILGRLQPIYISPELDSKLNIPSGISVEAVQAAINKHPDAKAVVITNPTFYGVCSDLEMIAEIAHAYNMVLLVDEAHGAHFGFHEKLPKTALQCGADIVAQSTHKTLASMTQSSMLHVRSNRVDIEKLKLFLQLTQTTSPSHIMLASLDTARYIMQYKGKELLEDVLAWCDKLRADLAGVEGLYCLSQQDIGREGIHDIDSTRITVCFKQLGISGTYADQMLRQRFKLQVELSDLNNIVAICTVGDTMEGIKRLSEGIEAIAREHREHRQQNTFSSITSPTTIPSMKLLPWEAIYRQKEEVAIENCLGRVCGEMIVPYPPGIPLIMPGEIISSDIIEYALLCRDSGIKINGTKDASLRYVTVLK
jgi:arginine/lysine/ornithine decarboxylase